jgi:nicotinamide mononucleotide transporter
MIVIFTAWNYQVTLLEIFAVLASLIGVWLGTTGTRITWPWWILSSSLYGILFFNFELYASAILQFVFIVAAIWGWFGWGKDGAKPSKLIIKEKLIWFALSLTSGLILAPLLAQIGAAATWFDSFILVGSVVAQVLMVREKYEAWPIWAVVNVVATFHYARQELWFTSLLYLVFIFIAFVGWKKWLEKVNI